MAAETGAGKLTETEVEMIDTEPLSLSNWRKVVGLIQASLWEVCLE